MSVRVVHASGLVVGDGPSLRDGAVVLDDAGTVLDVGRASDVLPRSAGASVSKLAGVVFPGLVNAHTHLELSALAGSVAPGLGFADWARGMLSARRKASEEAMTAATREAVVTLERLATVAVGDVTNGLSPVGPLVAHGLRGAVFHEVFGAVRDVTLAKVAALEGEALAAGLHAESLLTWSPSAHTLHTTHPDAVRALVSLARSRGARTSLHLAEHAAERRALTQGEGPMIDFLRGLGVPEGAFAWPGLGPIAYARSLFGLGPDVVLVHLTDATEEELDAVAEDGAEVVVCPRSNLFIEGRLPDVKSMISRGICPAIGTDSLASSPSLDVLDDAFVLTSELGLSADLALTMATHHGARALGLAGHGRIARGTSPGIFGVTTEVREGPAEALLLGRALPRTRLDTRNEGAGGR